MGGCGKGLTTGRGEGQNLKVKNRPSYREFVSVKSIQRIVSRKVLRELLNLLMP